MSAPSTGAPVLAPLSLGRARVLITNDDGIDAEGIGVLQRLIAPHVAELWVAAPSGGRSAASAMMSLRRRIGVEKRGTRLFSIDGSPADSVTVALQHLMAGQAPDLVLSGINHGANLGDDLNYSGTVGAALAAAIDGIPAIALSVGHKAEGYAAGHDWTQAEARGASIIQWLCETGFAPGGLYAVNFPDTPDDRDAPALIRPAGQQGRSFYLQEDGDGHLLVRHGGDRGVDQSACDYAAIREGRIAITPITIDRTDHAVLAALAGGPEAP